MNEGTGLSTPSVISLFTGAGGLDAGLEAAGFDVLLCSEIDSDARETLQSTRPGWLLARPSDITEARPQSFLEQANLRPGELALLSAGPPCQPFSKSAYWATGTTRRLKDPRATTLDAFVRFAEALLPQAILLENVAGLSLNRKDDAIAFIKESFHRINEKKKTRYLPEVIRLNAADYGVPQYRERLFIIATVDGTRFRPPSPTHGDRVGMRPRTTAWDAIAHLDAEDWPTELVPSGKWAGLLPSIPEGKNYAWHSSRGGGEELFGWRTRYWSFLLKLAKDRPSWTIQASPGPATGPFHWRSRLLSVEELCRLQTFPPNYSVLSSRKSAVQQIGNAVPSAIGEILGLEIRRQFFGERLNKQPSLIPQNREDCPPPEPIAPVPSCYLSLRGNYPDHPGPGMGPGARKRRMEETHSDSTS